MGNWIGGKGNLDKGGTTVLIGSQGFIEASGGIPSFGFFKVMILYLEWVSETSEWFIKAQIAGHHPRSF